MDYAGEKIEISGTIVLFKNDMNMLRRTIDSFLRIPITKRLFLIDNSPTNFFEKKFNHNDIEYIYLNGNVGFGSGHNIVLTKIYKRSKYHLILNPDVYFEPEVVPNMLKILEQDQRTAMIAPRVLYPNGKHQYSCRRFPSFFELAARRLPVLKMVLSDKIRRGEYKDKNLLNPFYAEYVSGCFQLYRTEDFVDIEGFDERYFMYMEDVDICRKLYEKKRKILYFPKEVIHHYFEKGSSRKIKLLYYHVTSIFQYFYKWRVIYKYQ